MHSSYEGLGDHSKENHMQKCYYIMNLLKALNPKVWESHKAEFEDLTPEASYAFYHKIVEIYSGLVKAQESGAIKKVPAKKVPAKKPAKKVAKKAPAKKAPAKKPAKKVAKKAPVKKKAVAKKPAKKVAKKTAKKVVKKSPAKKAVKKKK